MPATETLPKDATTTLDWSWEQYEPFYQRLLDLDLSAETLDTFMSEWSRLTDLISETEQRLTVARTVNTADEVANARFDAYIENVYPKAEEFSQRLKEKLLGSGLEPAGFEIPLMRMRHEAELFREANVPLLAEDQKLQLEYQEIIGSQTVNWKGDELPVPRMLPLLQDPNRETREEAWRLLAERRYQDRDRLDDLWRRMLDCRAQQAKNAGLADYREYRWRQLGRVDYTPEHNKRFHKAVKEIATPSYRRILERRRSSLGLDHLRPWDINVDAQNRDPLRPFASAEEFMDGVSRIFHDVDPALGREFDEMGRRNLLDLESRKNKGPGGYCTTFSASREPFIFMNAAGTHSDVQTLLHEGGHAFHVFETVGLPYHEQREVPVEFSEVASMSMELLAAPYLTKDAGGFYSNEDAARARVEALERMVYLWIYASCTDAFQHWVYENPEAARDPDACDAKWLELRHEYFLDSVDWTGLEQYLGSGWRDILHIFVVPFYIIEYCLAQLAAVQLWAHAREDQRGTVERYRKALALGGTRSLPDLYEAVGAEFDFGERTLAPGVGLIESTLDELYPLAGS